MTPRGPRRGWVASEIRPRIVRPSWPRSTGRVGLGMRRRVCGNGHDAEDVSQGVAVRVWKHLGEWSRLRDYRDWLLTIAYRAHLDHRARHPPRACAVFRRRRGTGPRRNRPRSCGDRRAGPAGQRGGGRAPATAPRGSRAARQGGLSLRPVVAATGASIGTVRSRLNAGLEQLQHDQGCEETSLIRPHTPANSSPNAAGWPSGRPVRWSE